MTDIQDWTENISECKKLIISWYHPRACDIASGRRPFPVHIDIELKNGQQVTGYVYPELQGEYSDEDWAAMRRAHVVNTSMRDIR
jgi:hypothetical protein